MFCWIGLNHKVEENTDIYSWNITSKMKRDKRSFAGCRYLLKAEIKGKKIFSYRIFKVYH